MTRTMLWGAGSVLMLWAVAVRADDKTAIKSDQHQMEHMTISKVDAHNKTITAQVKDKSGKEEEKTFHFADNAKILDSWGSQAQLDAFNKDDEVCLKLNSDGKVEELREQSNARIKDVDAKKGTVTVEMTDPSGKDVTKTFHLTSDTMYVDSAGHVAVADLFRSGDYVLFVEERGDVKSMKKSDQAHVSKQKKEAGTKSDTKPSK